MQETTIKVKGMVCGGCENRVKNALETIEDIKEVDANYKTGIVKVVYNGNIDTKIMEDTIEDIGFEIEKEN